MINEDIEKIAICPICLEILTTNIYFASDSYLYHKNCFIKLNFKSAISRQDFSYYLPVNKVVKCKVYFEKDIKQNFKIIIYDLGGFNQDGFKIRIFYRDGLLINVIGGNGFNKNKELVCEEKIKQALRETPWNIYYVCEVFRNIYEIMEECVRSNPNTYQNVTLHLKQNVNLAIFFLQRGGSFSLISKHLRNTKKFGTIAVKNKPNIFQCVGKILKDDDDMFKLAFQQNEKILWYASERLRKNNIQS